LPRALAGAALGDSGANALPPAAPKLPNEKNRLLEYIALFAKLGWGKVKPHPKTKQQHIWLEAAVQTKM